MLDKELEDRLAEWILEMLQSGLSTSPSLINKALKIYLHKSGIRIKGFNAGKSWFYGFLRRHPEIQNARMEKSKQNVHSSCEVAENNEISDTVLMQQHLKSSQQKPDDLEPSEYSLHYYAYLNQMDNIAVSSEDDYEEEETCVEKEELSYVAPTRQQDSNTMSSEDDYDEEEHCIEKKEELLYIAPIQQLSGKNF